MLVLLAPARNVRPAEFPGVAPTAPLFPQKTAALVAALRQCGPMALEVLVGADPQKALALFDLYQTFGQHPPTPALASFYGAVFRNLNVAAFDSEDFAFAQRTFRIFSALYGVLRPSDGIHPYRLGLDCAPSGLPDLYAFWGDSIYQALFPADEPVISLCSHEYMKLVTPYLQPRDRILACRFLVQRGDGKTGGTVATVRIARGQMARFIVEQRLTEPEELKLFDWNGYGFLPGRSSPTEFVFVQRK